MITPWHLSVWGAPVPEQPLEAQLPHDHIEQVGADVVALFHIPDQHEPVEDRVDSSRYAEGFLMHQSEHICGYDGILGPTDRAQAVLDVAAGLAGAERAQMAARDHPLLDLLEGAVGQGVAELGLPQKDDLDSGASARR